MSDKINNSKIQILYNLVADNEKQSDEFLNLLYSSPYDFNVEFPHQRRDFSYLDNIYRRIHNNKFMKEDDKIICAQFFTGSLDDLLSLIHLVELKVHVKLFCFDFGQMDIILNNPYFKHFLDCHKINIDIIKIKNTSNFFDFNNKQKRFLSEINNLCLLLNKLGFKYLMLSTRIIDNKSIHELFRLHYFVNSISMFDLSMNLNNINYWEFSKNKLLHSQSQEVVDIINSISERKIITIQCDNPKPDCQCSECRKIEIILD